MRMILLSAVFAVSMMFLFEEAKAVTIESDGYIGSGLSASSVGTLVSAIRASGYTCDSVTTATKLWSDMGFRVRCNRSRYSYKVLIDSSGNYAVLPN